MATRDCDWAGDKVDIFKSGCRSQSHFVFFAQMPKGSPPEALIYACRAHVGDLWKAFKNDVTRLAIERKTPVHFVLVDMHLNQDWRVKYNIRHDL